MHGIFPLTLLDLEYALSLQLHTKLLGTPISREMPRSASDEIDELREVAGSLADHDVLRLQRPINTEADHEDDDDGGGGDSQSPGPSEHV